ncbi:hypothetical protein Srot_0260 [Segniliparus rotundus DSM 44985]|uniref:YbaB/EbfC DNA-binding family protein n=1 Tax=Segniliparus rotundus (strain ATCC BAA-972 / CDC 1076 / CIP 108378 / DSM 44985 / JCM 13578) TaxID=640132 RepID=D6ZAY8_SEGRD|nr:hypothetical protein [Segniliparus rotundus]ADG96747.1 hypothetical protein Srot_0260 [Segniliparus rotundus DSM 44985]
MIPMPEFKDFDDWEREIKRIQDQTIQTLKAVSAAAQKSRGSGAAERGMIMVEMNAKGDYETLVIDNAAFRFGPTRLAAGILQAMRAAHNARLRTIREDAVEQVGEDAVGGAFTPKLYPDPDDETPPDDEDEDQPQRRW